MLQRFNVFQILLLLCLLSFLPLSAEAQRRRRDRFRQQISSSTVLECRVFCSDAKIRTGVAELTWRSSEARLSESTIEVTVYKDGFRKGAYVALGSEKGERSYQPQSLKRAQEPIPALSKLVVVNASSLRERAGVVAVQIEGLEPGLNYFWRVVSRTTGRQIAQGTAKCQAPVCPADLQPDVIP